MARSASERFAVAAVLLGAAALFKSTSFVAPAGDRLVVANSDVAAGSLAGASTATIAAQRAAASGSADAALRAVSVGMRAGKELEGKVALVTGASRGIGAAIAQKLAEAGATVVGTATSDSGAEAISGRFTGDLKGEGMKLDVGDSADVDAFMKALTEKYGSPDILVNNAGITKDGLMMRMKEDQWDAVINTNLNSIYRMTKAASKAMMKKRWGRIISISSVVGSMGNAGQTNYAAAKAGLEGFTRAYAREVGSRGITVNSVAPGFIATDMTDVLPDELKAKLLENVPVGRLGAPDEIADAVMYLASPSTSYVTGHTLHVNGGMYMA
jgi:3-oxoacyl-[acyl-carrier protein] reductase